MLKILNLMQLGKVDGCTWYRVKQLTDEVRRQKLADPHYLDFGLSDDVFDEVLVKADVYYSRLNPQLHYVMDLLPEHVPFVLDIDDSIHDVNPLSDHYRHLGTREITLSGGTKLWEDGVNIDLEKNKTTVEAYEKALTKATVVTVTTFELKQYAEQYNENVVVIPNAVDLSLFPHVKSKNKVGINMVWSGGSSHFEDLAEVSPVLLMLMEDFKDLHFHILGVPFEGIIKGLPQDRVHKYSWCSADAHGYRLACVDPDIALAPIRDTRFNRLKSSIKMYEMAALKAPTVARDIPPYADDIIHEKTGMLYNDNKELYECVAKLINDPLLRGSLGAGAYEYVKETRQLKDVAKDFIELMQGVADAAKA